MIGQRTVLCLALVLSGTAAGQAPDGDALKQQNQLLQAENAALKEQIQKLKKELADLKGETAAPAKGDKPADAFAVGTTFRGKGVLASDKSEYKLTLVITKRNGTKFDGDLTVGDSRTIKVSGTAPLNTGGVSFTTEKSGYFQLKVVGKLTNGEIGFSFTGTNSTGYNISGTGNLR